MISSMTGFAAVTIDSEVGSYSIELRSVNHRYLEINTRLPEWMRTHETKIRQCIQHTLKRGKVDCAIKFKQTDRHQDQLHVDEEKLNALVNALEVVTKHAPTAQQPSALQLLNWPDVIVDSQPDAAAIEKQLFQTIEQSLNQLLATRQAEGEKLKVFILQRIDIIEALTNTMRERYPAIIDNIRTRYTTRVNELNDNLDQERIEQEIALMAQKLDIAEELDRLNAHCEASRQALQSDDPIGRRLDFLMQEFNREANTLGSKSGDTETSQAAIELKVNIEQMREQIQNIE